MAPQQPNEPGIPTLTDALIARGPTPREHRAGDECNQAAP
jgi:hypothetical protein